MLKAAAFEALASGYTVTYVPSHTSLYAAEEHYIKKFSTIIMFVGLRVLQTWAKITSGILEVISAKWLDLRWE